MKSKKILITISILIFSVSTLFAQPGGPPDPPGSHGESGDQTPGGNAPLNGGVFMLLGLGVVYCSTKVLRNRNLLTEVNNEKR